MTDDQTIIVPPSEDPQTITVTVEVEDGISPSDDVGNDAITEEDPSVGHIAVEE